MSRLTSNRSGVTYVLNSDTTLSASSFPINARLVQPLAPSVAGRRRHLGFGDLPPLCARVVRDAPFVRAGHQWRADHEVGRGAVTCHGDVPHDRDPQQRFDIGVVRLRLERIPEEDQGSRSCRRRSWPRSGGRRRAAPTGGRSPAGRARAGSIVPVVPVATRSWAASMPRL